MTVRASLSGARSFHAHWRMRDCCLGFDIVLTRCLHHWQQAVSVWRPGTGMTKLLEAYQARLAQEAAELAEETRNPAPVVEQE